VKQLKQQYKADTYTYIQIHINNNVATIPD